MLKKIILALSLFTAQVTLIAMGPMTEKELAQFKAEFKGLPGLPLMIRELNQRASLNKHLKQQMESDANWFEKMGNKNKAGEFRAIAANYAVDEHRGRQKAQALEELLAEHSLSTDH